MAVASIDIPAMRSLVSSLDKAVSGVPGYQQSLVNILGGVDVDSSPASRITSVIAWVNAATPDLKRRLALAESINAAHPSLHGVVPDNADFEKLLPTMNPTMAQNLGMTDAKKLKDSDGTLDQTLIDDLKKYHNDPYFAAGLAANLSPDDLAKIVNLASDHRDHSPPGSDDYNKWFDQYRGLLSSLGATVGTATRNTGSLALPPDYAQGWANTVKRERDDEKYHAGDAQALGYLLEFGEYSTPFLDKVSSQAYDYERSKHGKAVWGPKARIGLQVIDPGGDGVQGPADVLPNILTALGHNPEAAQHFFDVPKGATEDIKINGQTLHVNKRLKYLLQDRTWATDRGSDEGRGLGAALDAATTYFRDAGPTGNISATIASQTFVVIGQKTGQGKHGGDWYELGLNQHDGWKMSANLRPAIANMVASYAPDLMRVSGLVDSQSDSLGGDWTTKSDRGIFPPGGPWGAQMDKNLMAKILGTLGEDPKNTDIVTAGVNAAAQLRMSYALQQALKTGGKPPAPVAMITGDKYVDLVNGASNEIAGTLAFVINQAYQGDKTNQDLQKKRAAALSRAMGIALQMPFLANPEGKAWTGFLLDQLKDTALDKIGEGPDADAKGTYNETAGDAQKNLQHTMLNYLLANGYLDKKYYDAAGPGYSAPPSAAFQHDGHGKLVQPPQFNFTSKAYNEWARKGQNFQAWLNTNVITPFRAAFPALGAE